MRRGFTLLEMMTAVTVFSIVIVSVLSLFIGVERLVRTAYAEAELSVRMRELREKILFHASPMTGGKKHAGVLSGMPKSALAIEGGFKIYLRAPAFNLSDGAISYQDIQLVRETAGGSGRGWFKNDSIQDPYRSRWFRLDEIGPLGQTEAHLGYLGDNAIDDDLLSTSRADDRGIFFIDLGAEVGGVTHRERIAVPVFGTEQVRNAAHVFHDR